MTEITGFTDDGRALFGEPLPLKKEKSHNTGLPSWKEVIGFTDDNGMVTIHKPSDEMIQIANEQFDIDLRFVDEEPNIQYDPNVMIDVELQDDGDGDNCWQVTFGRYDKTDILITMQEENEIYDRITKALNKYHLHYLDDNGFDFVESEGSISRAMRLAMETDLKENFNIKLHIIRNGHSC